MQPLRILCILQQNSQNGVHQLLFSFLSIVLAIIKHYSICTTSRSLCFGTCTGLFVSVVLFIHASISSFAGASASLSPLLLIYFIFLLFFLFPLASLFCLIFFFHPIDRAGIQLQLLATFLFWGLVSATACLIHQERSTSRPHQRFQATSDDVNFLFR
jgi:hypothetical protein